MSEKISTIIISEQDSFKTILKLYLKEYGGFECVEDFSGLSDIYNTVSVLEKSFIIIDLENEFEKYADFIKKLDFQNCRVLAVSDNPDVDLIVKVMRNGVKEFISSPVIKSEFFDVLKRVSEQLNGKTESRTCASI